jgi:hypothetical protein
MKRRGIVGAFAEHLMKRQNTLVADGLIPNVNWPSLSEGA